MFPSREIWSALATAITFAAFFPYLRGILRGTVRPHVFSWVIWGITTMVVFFAQLQARGGVGAWPIGLSGVITLVTAALAFARRADVGITRADWVFFLAALSSLPLWWFTADPTWAVVVLTAVDTLGFGPTLRHAWAKPHAESQLFYFLFLARNLTVLPALEQRNVATVLFPAVMAVACAVVMGVIAARRRTVPRPA